MTAPLSTSNELASLVSRTIDILCEPGIADEDVEARVLMLAGDAMLRRRLIEWIPEPFGYVLAAHVAQMVPPKTFAAPLGHERWQEFPIKAEPIFEFALVAAVEMIHSTENEQAFKAIAARSSSSQLMSLALDDGKTLDDLKGAALNPVYFLGIPATVYGARPLRWWHVLFGSAPKGLMKAKSAEGGELPSTP